MNIESSAQRIEELLDRIGETDPEAAGLAEALVRELVSLYGAGLVRILDRLGAAAPGALAELAEDHLVAGLLILHDLHPSDVGERVETALDSVRPYLASHGGGVQLLGVDGGVVRLRLDGACDGCSASQVTLRLAVEEAVHSAAPEIERIEAEASTTPPHPPPAAPLTSPLIPAESLLARRSGTEVVR